MAENSKIEWCDHTVNLWWGCSKVHTGCKNCYAEYFSDTRYKKDLWGDKKDRQRIKSSFSDLDKYQAEAFKKDVKYKIFCGSMMDIFEESKPLLNPTDEFKTTADLRQRLFVKIAAGNYDNLIFLFLTKRPDNIEYMLPALWLDGQKNIWLGTSISNQETAYTASDSFIKYGKNNLFYSIEPQVDSIEHLPLTGIGWIIQGGESGHGKRPFDLKWAYLLKGHCENHSVPYFFKQIDKIKPIPEDLLIRQFPEF